MTEENLAWSELQYISIFAKNNIMETEVKQNIMGYEPIPKLIMKLSLPLMLSMLTYHEAIASIDAQHAHPGSLQCR